MASERRWVIDTNVLISRFLKEDGTPARAVDKAVASGQLLMSDDTLSEFRDVMMRPRFDRYHSPQTRRRLLEVTSALAQLVHITRRIQACRDPRDDKFLDVAVNGEAEAIITGDRALLDLHPFHGVRILMPSAFLAED